jgi:hypothetical protein
MSKMYIRVKKDGFIYDYNEILAKNPACEVIPEEVAFPERFVPEHVAERVGAPEKPKRTVKRKAALDLTTADIPEAPPYTSPELAEEAARGMP